MHVDTRGYVHMHVNLGMWCLALALGMWCLALAPLCFEAHLCWSDRALWVTLPSSSCSNSIVDHIRLHQATSGHIRGHQATSGHTRPHQGTAVSQQLSRFLPTGMSSHNFLPRTCSTTEHQEAEAFFLTLLHSVKS